MKLKYSVILPSLVLYPLLTIASPDCDSLRAAVDALQTELTFGKPVPAELFTKIGNPDKKIISGAIYRWHKNGYTLEIMLDNGERGIDSSSISLKSPPDESSKNAPAEFRAIYNKDAKLDIDISPQLAKANELLGTQDREKIDLTSYIWNCTANNILKVNGQWTPVEQRLKIVVDPDNKINQIYPPL